MMTSRRLSESEQRAADDNARSLRRNASWLHRYGYIVPTSELFTHGCGPVEVTIVRGEDSAEPFHKNAEDRPPEGWHVLAGGEMRRGAAYLVDVQLGKTMA